MIIISYGLINGKKLVIVLSLNDVIYQYNVPHFVLLKYWVGHGNKTKYK